MKPLLLKVNETATASFDIRYEKVPYFDNPWHYHPEFELTFITKSNGVRFIGDSIEPFDEGDLVLLGANLPHYWRSDKIFYSTDAPSHAEAIIMRFRIDLWGTQLLHTPEMQHIYHLLQRASHGIYFPQTTVQKVYPLLTNLLKTNGIERLVGWLQVFNILADTEDVHFLSKKSFSGLNAKEDSNRIGKILAYLQAHLSEPINLTDAATLANMNKAAFCRYFKQQTNKTFIEVLNELRIQSACRLLIDSDKDINQISYECGFQDISYFSQIFKAKKGMSASKFRNHQFNLPGKTLADNKAG